MAEHLHKPIVLAFAGPNGSGKTTVTKRMNVIGTYVNADDIKMNYGLSDLDAAQYAEEIRHTLVDKGEDLTFETVLSTDRNLRLLQKAKTKGYIIKCIYILTCNPEINVNRVRERFRTGEGHNVDENKVRSRYRKALGLLPEVIDVCDDIIVFDNSGRSPRIIFQKNNQGIVISSNAYWSEEDIKTLCGL